MKPPKLGPKPKCGRAVAAEARRMTENFMMSGIGEGADGEGSGTVADAKVIEGSA